MPHGEPLPAALPSGHEAICPYAAPLCPCSVPTPPSPFQGTARGTVTASALVSAPGRCCPRSHWPEAAPTIQPRSAPVGPYALGTRHLVLRPVFSFKNKAFSPVAPSGPALSVCDVHSWCRTEPVGRGVYHCLERRSLICFLIFISEAEHVGRGVLISYSRPPSVPGKRKENGS